MFSNSKHKIIIFYSLIIFFKREGRGMGCGNLEPDYMRGNFFKKKENWLNLRLIQIPYNGLKTLDT